MVFIEIIGLVALLTISHHVAAPLGGIFHFMVSYTTRIPLAGGFFNFLLAGPVKLSVVFKLIAWAISSSSVLAGLLLHRMVWGEGHGLYGYYVLLFFCTIYLINIVYDIIYFKVLDMNSVTREVQQHLPKSLQSGFPTIMNDSEARLQVYRTTFVDINLPRFFSMLVNIGIVYYCLSHLGFIAAEGGSLPTLKECILTSFTLGNIVGTSGVSFTGDVWTVVSAFASFLVFFWLVLFIALVSSNVEREHESYLANESDNDTTSDFIEELAKRLYDQEANVRETK